MEYVELKSSLLTVRVNFRGAELSSIYNLKKDIEHIWQADANVWARHAPILFPIVGKVKDDKYTVEGKEYQLGQHGYARDEMFELEEITESQAVFKLSSNEGSLKKYPFKYNLFVKYKLEGSKLDISYIVENIDDKEILFGLGAHPGFTVPFNSDSGFEDYVLEFDKNEIADKHLISDNGLISGELHSHFLDNTNLIPLKYSTFSKGALVFEGLKSSYITIKSSKTDTSLKVGIEDFPLLGIWTMPGKKAPYICIEPWYGVADSESSSGIFGDKNAINKLAIGKEFEMKFFIEIA